MDKEKSDSPENVKIFIQNLHIPLSKDFHEPNFGDNFILADTLSSKGESSLKQGDLLEALNLFDQSIQLLPENASLYFRQGLSLFHYGMEKNKEKALLHAIKKFKNSAQLNPEFFSSWYYWAKSLCHLGKTFDEKHYFTEAEVKFKKALALSSSESTQCQVEIYCQIASVLARLATFSKEPIDWQQAIEFYQKAASESDTLQPEFWDEYARACLNLSYYINDIRLTVKAIHFFKHALSRCSSSLHTGWSHLSKALWHLYEFTHDEDHFTQASDCFSAALQTNPNDSALLLDFAELLLIAGRKSQDNKRLKLSIEKCFKAYSLNPHHARALAIWGEALSLLGEYGDRLDLLLEGQNKISQALDVNPLEKSISLCYGQSLCSLGRYYNEIDYFFQAIEKFQEGLSKDRTLHTHWHAIANCYLTIGCAESNPQMVEKSIRFFLKAIELKPNNSYYQFDYALCLSRLGELLEHPKWLEAALQQFERSLHLQKNAPYLHPDWLFQYARTLDLYGDFQEEDSLYARAIEILSHVMMIDPEFEGIQYQLGLCYSHLGELTGEIQNFYKSLHFFKLAARQEEENDVILLDLGITLINISQYTDDPAEAETCLRDSELKLTQAAKSGNLAAYYQLACLYSLTGQYCQAMRFLLKADSFEALPTLDEIQADEWLEGLRNTSEGREFLLTLEKRPHYQEER